MKKIPNFKKRKKKDNYFMTFSRFVTASLPAIGWTTGPPMEEQEKVPKKLKGSAIL